MRQKSSPLNFFAVFSATVQRFNLKFLQIYFWNCSTAKCQIKLDSIEK